MEHKIIIDNRGYHPTPDVVFTEEKEPARFTRQKPGTPEYENAPLEIRTVETIIGDREGFLRPGNVILFSRCEPAKNFCDAGTDPIRMEAEAYEAMKEALAAVDEARNKAQKACEYWSDLYGKIRAARPRV